MAKVAIVTGGARGAGVVGTVSERDTHLAQLRNLRAQAESDRDVGGLLRLGLLPDWSREISWRKALPSMTPGGV